MEGKRARTEEVETADEPKIEYVVILETEDGKSPVYGIKGPLNETQTKYLTEGIRTCPDEPECLRLLYMTGIWNIGSIDESDPFYASAKEGSAVGIPESQKIELEKSNWPNYPVMIVLVSEWS